MKKRKKPAPRGRNWLAVHAHFKSGAGSHGDKKKEQSRKKCRNTVKEE